MTNYPAPTWGDIDAFCQADRWEADRQTDHPFWEKTLPNGDVLSTHRSKKPTEVIGANLFGMILREQLKVTRAEFWQAIWTGKQVDRPVDPLEDVETYEPWVVQGLLAQGVREDEIRELTPAEARQRLEALWSGRGDGA